MDGRSISKSELRETSAIESEALNERVAAAEAADLVYVHDTSPGIHRERAGTGFYYRDSKGHRLSDAKQLARIRALAIPPAYEDVWICPNPNGHLQATGRDARGRKQYRYHERWREIRDANKYEEMIEFGRLLPELRARIASDMAKRGLTREKVLATIVELLQTTLIRIGNDDYAKENKSYGLTTLRSRHVAIEGGTLRFEFKGKSGKLWKLKLRDRRIARRQSLSRSARPGAVPIFRRRGQTPPHQFVGRECLSERNRRPRCHGEAFQNLGRHASCRDRPQQIAAACKHFSGKEDHKGGNRRCGHAARQYTDHLPQMLCPSRGADSLPRRRLHCRRVNGTANRDGAGGPAIRRRQAAHVSGSAAEKRSLTSGHPRNATPTPP
jgi:hypothetical protein